MFYFLIPLRGRQTATSWPQVCELLRGTLQSMLNQTDPDFQIIIAGHEPPDLGDIVDPRVSFFSVDIPQPATREQQMADKGFKVRALAAAVRERGGGYVMYVDADDLVSERVVAFVRGDDNRIGYLAEQGYLLNGKTGTFKVLSNFNMLCGSCAIFHLAPEDLPRSADDPVRYVMDDYAGHKTLKATAAAKGRPLEPLPFPAVIYRTGHGENWSLHRGGRLRPPPGVLRLANALIPGRGMPRAVRDEFALS